MTKIKATQCDYGVNFNHNHFWARLMMALRDDIAAVDFVDRVLLDAVDNWRREC